MMGQANERIDITYSFVFFLKMMKTITETTTRGCLDFTA